MVRFQFHGADLLIACVIARSETTKQSPYSARTRLLRYARNDMFGADSPPRETDRLHSWSWFQWTGMRELVKL